MEGSGVIWNNILERIHRAVGSRGHGGGDGVSRRILGLLVGQLWDVGWECQVKHELGCHPEPSGPLELPWKQLEIGSAPQGRSHGSWGL